MMYLDSNVIASMLGDPGPHLLNPVCRSTAPQTPNPAASVRGLSHCYLPLHPGTAECVHAYLEAAGHTEQPNAALFQSARGSAGHAITPDGVYKVVLAYAAKARIAIDGLGVHSLRPTAATNALEHEADIAKVQEWLGHANIAATRIYDHRRHRPEDSPTFKVAY
jgi:site-specific recombinase XerD